MLFDVAEERGCRGKCPGALGVAKEYLKGKTEIESELAARIMMHCCKNVFASKLRRILFPEPVYFSFDDPPFVESPLVKSPVVEFPSIEISVEKIQERAEQVYFDRVFEEYKKHLKNFEKKEK